ncbi:DNA topoisomerase IB [Plastoroseomonas arctica]|uniref:DNA topoisomerase n=1 Tax=Plastoroseomonas arctica TaxID=1509237 RepID=A0AAF1JUU7_9PROT|nr:DNA topoisomerase IB [Plastoroseomonas arctica]MBR0654181.1 DNA topoisomerase IB [Plastoroseomonas arctica]
MSTSLIIPGLRYVTVGEPGLRRLGKPPRFRYVDPDGRPLREATALQRIRMLAIPPAYQDVWICADADGHLQAIGTDARGRRQYRYHADWRTHRDSGKFARLTQFAESMPAIRARVAADLELRGLPRAKVLATVVRLLETTLARVGNEEYARTNESYGVTTLRNEHVAVQGSAMRFHFRGKGGKIWRLKLEDRRVAGVLRRCQELPGEQLFQYLDEDGALQGIGSSDVNAYLREITGEGVTAKDFRTWAATVNATFALLAMPRAESQTALKRQLNEAIKATAARLGNTPTICRKCYIHPAVQEAYLGGGLALRLMAAGAEAHALRPEEAAVLRFLRRAGAAQRQQAA